MVGTQIFDVEFEKKDFVLTESGTIAYKKANSIIPGHFNYVFDFAESSLKNSPFDFKVHVCSVVNPTLKTNFDHFDFFVIKNQSI